MTEYRGNLLLAGGLQDDRGDSGTFSGTLGIDLTSTVDSTGNGTATETIRGRINESYTYAGVSRTNTTPLNFTTPSFAFRFGTFNETQTIPAEIDGIGLAITLSGTADTNQQEIATNLLISLTGVYQGIGISGSITATGSLAVVPMPMISGSVAGQSASDQAAVAPFGHVTITDASANQTETVMVTLSAAADGTLTNLGGGSFNAATGQYVVSGSAATVTSAIEGLVFAPTIQGLLPGQSRTTTFTISALDGAFVPRRPIRRPPSPAPTPPSFWPDPRRNM